MITQGISVINGKGGTGKTSLVCNMAGIAAKVGYRVLVVDLDPQCNTSLDLGYDKHPHDNNLLHALTLGAAPAVLKDVGAREGLDVLPAGENVAEWTVHAAMLTMREGAKVRPNLGLEAILSPFEGEYDLILIDCPPGIGELQLLALSAARFAIVPTKPDDASLEGLELVSKRFASSREVNPLLELLGVVVFGVESGATVIRSDALRKVQAALGPAAPFKATVRHLSAPSVGARNRRQLVHEYETDAKTQEPFWAALRAGAPGKHNKRLSAKSSSTLATDYQNLTAEVITRMQASMAKDSDEHAAV